MKKELNGAGGLLLTSLVALTASCSDTKEAAEVQAASITLSPLFGARVDQVYAVTCSTLEEAGYVLRALAIGVLNERGHVSTRVDTAGEDPEVLKGFLAGDGEVAFVAEAVADHPDGRSIRVLFTPRNLVSTTVGFEVRGIEGSDVSVGFESLKDESMMIGPLIETIRKRLRSSKPAAD